MKKILIFGATGMAGHVVFQYLLETGQYDITNIVFRSPLNKDSIVLDVTNFTEVEDVVNRICPDIIINCVGILVHGSVGQPSNAILLNSYFPHFLKKISDEIGAKVIHISTDCVFSGKKGNYTELDFRDADDIYGRSKALGELDNEKDLTIRTSIIGPEIKKNGEGLFHWFMTSNKAVNGYVTAIWGGVTTLELAKAIDTMIHDNTTGLVHLSNGEGISKYNLLRCFKTIWRKSDIEIFPVDANGVNKSIAVSSKFSYQVPTYKKMLEELHSWMISHRELYRQYTF